MARWRWIHHEGGRLYDVGMNADGSLHNPNGYDPAIVCAAIAAAEARNREKRQKAAIKAVVTRARRLERRVYQIAKAIADGRKLGPAKACAICGRGLADEASKQRGVGPECWGRVLEGIERLTAVAPQGGTPWAA